MFLFDLQSLARTVRVDIKIMQPILLNFSNLHLESVCFYYDIQIF